LPWGNYGRLVINDHDKNFYPPPPPPRGGAWFPNSGLHLAANAEKNTPFLGICTVYLGKSVCSKHKNTLKHAQNFVGMYSAKLLSHPRPFHNEESMTRLRGMNPACESTNPAQAAGYGCSHKVFDSGYIPLIPPKGSHTRVCRGYVPFARIKVDVRLSGEHISI
jgi:hypothetical protein